MAETMLRVLAAVLAVYAANAEKTNSVDVLSTKERGDQTLYSFSWVENLHEEAEGNATLQVCFESGSEFEAPSLKFQLTYTNEDDNEISVACDAPVVKLEDGVFCGNFLVEIDTLSYSTQQTYIINSDEVYALAQFTMKISPGTLKTEHLTVANVTRVTGLTDYGLEDCIADTHSSCIVATDSPADELCTSVDDEFQSHNASIFVCDTTFQVVSVDAQTQGTRTVIVYDDDNTVQVTTSSPETSTVELVISDPADDGGYVACVGSTCPAMASPGTSVYSVVVVEINTATNEALSSDRVAVQDLNLVVVSTDDVIDFHFVNLNEDRMYQLFSNGTSEELFNGEPIFLDCTGVPGDVPCYAFVTRDHVPAYLGVRYGDQTHEIVTKIRYEEP